MLEELNSALSKVDSYYTDFAGTLYDLYYDQKNGMDTIFTKEEQDYLATKPKVMVVVSERRQPYEYYDKTQKKYCGIIPDVLDQIEDFTGIRFEYAQSKNRYEYLKQNIGQNIITSCSSDINIAKSKNLKITQPFVEGSISIIRRANQKKIKKVAMIEETYLNQIVKENYPKWKTIIYKTKEQCLDAVKKGKCDGCVMNGYEADYFLAMGQYQYLHEEGLERRKQDICFGVEEHSDAMLFGILSKALLMIPTQEYDSLIRKHALATSKQTVKDFIYSNPVEVIVISSILLFLIILTGYLIVYARFMKRKNIEVIKANQAKSDFLSRVSHDLRTPMNTIVNLTNIVEKELDDPEEAKNDLKKMKTSNQFLLALINDVLDMSRIEDDRLELHPERYSYKEFLDYMVSTFEPLCKEKEIHLSIKKGVQDVDIIIDKVRFNQMCFNLMANAIKYTPEGGDVVFEMVHGSIKGEELPCDIYIRDNGIGMSKEFQEKMFDPFAQEGRAYKTVEGTGLGLSIVKKIIDLMQGTIETESEVGKGTTIHIHLNMLIAKNESRQFEEEIDLNQLEGLNVLLVEDHPLNQEIAKKLLMQVGVKVDIVGNGKEAVEICSRQLEQFDCILMDIRMPELDGYEATKQIRLINTQKAKEIPIIAMTANAYDEDIRKCKQIGMNAHVAKPIDPKKLYRELIKQCFSQK